MERHTHHDAPEAWSLTGNPNSEGVSKETLLVCLCSREDARQDSHCHERNLSAEKRITSEGDRKF
ncbi:MAG: hypothetical protein JWN14_1214 [Chthonomonadales bacterium]|nr:hypothetical protein [Chthonomonadales bacterium]